jgi:FtsH-binding integral membrane protein
MYENSMNLYRTAGEINEAMIRVYNNMFLAVLNSMVVSLLVSSSPALMTFLFTGVMKWIVMFAPLVAILVMSFGLHKLTRPQAQMALHGFAALMGLSFATIFIVFTIGSIVSAFMGAAVLFGTMSLYGYFTKKDLTSLGQFMFVGLIAIIIASIINIFIGSSVVAMVISALAIIIFMGLTAYDTQRIRQEVSVNSGEGKEEIIGALSLYLNFINIFLSLLQLFGNRNE